MKWSLEYSFDSYSMAYYITSWHQYCTDHDLVNASARIRKKAMAKPSGKVNSYK